MLPHGGRGPPARILGLVLPCGVCTPASAGVEDEIEEANGSAGAYAPTLPLSQSFLLLLCHLALVFISLRYTIKVCALVLHRSNKNHQGLHDSNLQSILIPQDLAFSLLSHIFLVNQGLTPLAVM